MTCVGNTHTWTNPNPSGELCVCGAIYAPRRAHTYQHRGYKGQKFDLPEGWGTVTLPDNGDYQIIVTLGDPALNQKSGLMIIRTGD